MKRIKFLLFAVLALSAVLFFQSCNNEDEVTPPDIPDAPVAAFMAEPTSVEEGGTVVFTDQSENVPTSWSWDFGDGNTSSEQNPSHVYEIAGTYEVSLVATNEGGSDTETKADFITVTLVEVGPGIELVTVDGGTFEMGCTDEQSNCGNDESPVVTVTVTGFEISIFEITNQQYATFMNEKGVQSDGSFSGTQYIEMENSKSQIKFADGQFNAVIGKENHPVLAVTWFGAKAFCEQYGGRLPTEAEWEFAARGGNNATVTLYAGSNNIDEVAWYYENADNKTQEVGTKSPNELGIYDMSGNVWEWCSDWYLEDYYYGGPKDNPTGPSV